MNQELLKKLFISRLTEDGKIKLTLYDETMEDINQAIFDKEGQTCSNIDLNAILDKFELALSDYNWIMRNGYIQIQKEKFQLLKNVRNTDAD